MQTEFDEYKIQKEDQINSLKIENENNKKYIKQLKNKEKEDDEMKNKSNSTGNNILKLIDKMKKRRDELISFKNGIKEEVNKEFGVDI